MNLEDLRDRHLGETVWVLGSGPSLNFLDASFFADKLVVSTNYSAKTFGIAPHYVFSHYHHVTRQTVATVAKVTLRHDTKSHQVWSGEQPDDVVLIEQDSVKGPGDSWNPLTTHAPRSDSLVYGSSSLHGAMHLAAWVGGKHLVLVGADCGTIDGEHRIGGYVKGDTPWALYNHHHLLMKQFLVENYGVTVYSLNPFINFNLEGHTFSGV